MPTSAKASAFVKTTADKSAGKPLGHGFECGRHRTDQLADARIVDQSRIDCRTAALNF